MNLREYWTKRFEKELGTLSEDDKEVLENTISFEESYNKVTLLR